MLDLYDGIMEFFETEKEALKAAVVSLEQYCHQGPWANVADRPEVLVMQVARRLAVTSADDGAEHDRRWVKLMN